FPSGVIGLQRAQRPQEGALHVRNEIGTDDAGASLPQVRPRVVAAPKSAYGRPEGSRPAPMSEPIPMPFGTFISLPLLRACRWGRWRCHSRHESKCGLA